MQRFVQRVSRGKMKTESQVDPEADVVSSAKRPRTAAERKRDQRAREAAAKANETRYEAAKNFETIEEFHAYMRRTLSTEQIENYEQQQADALLQTMRVREMVNVELSAEDLSDAEYKQSFSNAYAEIKAFVASHGGELSLTHIHGFWKSAQELKRIEEWHEQEATRVALLYGYFISVPSKNMIALDSFAKRVNPVRYIQRCIEKDYKGRPCENEATHDVWYCEAHWREREARAVKRYAPPAPREDRPYMVAGRLYPSGEI